MLCYLNLTFRTMIKTSKKIIKSADNYSLPYLQFEPENKDSNKSIILVYEIFGLTDHIKNVAKIKSGGVWAGSQGGPGEVLEALWSAF